MPRISHCLVVVALALAACRDAPPPETAPSAAVGETWKGALAAAEVKRFELACQAGEVLVVSAHQRGVDLSLRLLGAGGGALGEASLVSGVEGVETIAGRVPTGGVCGIEVRPALEGAEGGFEVRLDARGPAEGPLKARLEAHEAMASGDWARARALWGALSERGLEGFALDQVGRAAKAAGDRSKALEIRSEALAIKREAGDRAGQMDTLRGIGNLQRYLGAPEAAREAYTASLALAREVGDPVGVAGNLLNLGLLAGDRGDHEAAAKAHREALASFEALKDPRNQAVAHHALAQSYRRMGDLRRALSHLHACLKAAREAKYTRREAGCRSSLGHLHLNLTGDLDAAMAAFEAALALRRADNDRDDRIAAEIGAIGGVWLERGEPAKAQPLLEEALARLREAAAKPGIAQTLWALGVAHHWQNRPERARAAFEEALRINEALGAARHQARALAGLALVLRFEDRYREALAAVDKAIAIVEAQRAHIGDLELRRRYFGTVESLYDLALDLLRELSTTEGDAYVERALLMSERAKARTLLETLAGLGATSAEAAPVPKSARALQEALPEAASLVSFAASDRDVMSFVVVGWGEAGVVLNSAEPLDAVERAARAYLADLGDEAARKKLAGLLFPGTGLSLERRVYVVPDGLLHYVPFGALLGPSHEVVVLPSAAMLLQAPGARGAGALVLADPVFDGRDPRVGVAHAEPPDRPLRRLRFTEAEAQAVERALGRGVVVKRGLRATREALFEGAPGKRYLHLATHAWVDAAYPERTGLALSRVDAQGTRVDGEVRLDDLLKLELDAELVVLSACETALGEYIAGEGLVGLTRGFLQAGARRVIASLWKVDDRATAALMAHLYAGLAKGDPPAAALRAAQDALRASARWSAPEHWAGFVVHGVGP